MLKTVDYIYAIDPKTIKNVVAQIHPASWHRLGKENKPFANIILNMYIWPVCKKHSYLFPSFIDTKSIHKQDPEG